MPTGKPLTQSERLLRRIISDLTALAKLAENGEEARRKLNAARAALRGETLVDDLTVARRRAKEQKETAVSEAS